MNSGPETRLKTRQRGERHHPAVLVSDIKLADVLRLGAVVALRLDVDLPLPAEAIEVVDEQSPHEGLNGAVHIGDGHCLLDHLVAVHVDELLGHASQERGTDARDLRTLAGSRQERVQVVGEELHILAGTVFEDEGESARGAHAGNGGRRKIKCDPLRQLAEGSIQARLNHLKLGFPVGCARPTASR